MHSLACELLLWVAREPEHPWAWSLPSPDHMSGALHWPVEVAALLGSSHKAVALQRDLVRLTTPKP